MGCAWTPFKSVREAGLAQGISVITPAFKAEHTIARAVKSVLAQTHTHFEHIIVADDEADYAAILQKQGFADNRLQFFRTGSFGSGSPPARNIGIEAAQYRYAAILDADDMMAPEKLEQALEALSEFGIVSSALQVIGPALEPLRTVGAGPDRVLRAADYKFTNFSMDSMLVYDRQRADPRFDPSFPRLTDIDFLLKLFAHNEACFHLGTPLHSYVKEPNSISNSPGAGEEIIATKQRLLKQLANGYYPMADPEGIAGMTRFWQTSLAAEEAYVLLLAQEPNLLFEDHLEPRLKALVTSDL